MYNCESIKASIENGLPNSKATISNPRKDNEHFIAEVECSKFEGKSLIEQHRMVYDTLKKEFGEGLHSLSLKTKWMKK